MKKILTLLLVLTVFVCANAQEEAAIWYFGNKAGLNFNSGAPVALTDGELNTIEGCATISDTNGALLFYTDGITVWGKDHQPMPNGNGLGGDPSSTQSGIIIPWPGVPDLYYVFTTDDRGNANGLQYNIVDMTLNGGLGDVTSNNNVLQLNMTEKLTAVLHANGTDIWVISHRLNSNEYVSYQITPAGLNTTPVITPIGLTYSGGSNAIGYMKVSPNGEYLSIVGSGTAKGEVLEFNTNTGTLTNPINLSSFYSQYTQFRLINLYGVEFSPNSQVLYISNANNGIHQFNLTNYNAFDILNSGIQIAPTGAALEIGGMQLAIDGKIYVTQAPTNYLGAINSPNTIGLSCNYVENVVSLGSGISNIGLPPFIQSYFILGFTAENLCFGNSTQFDINATEPLTSILWNFGDGNTSTLENPTHTFTTSGTYMVSVSATTATDTKTESKEITINETPVANTPTDIEVCTTAATHEFDLSDKDAAILSSQLATDFQIKYFSSLIEAENNTNALPILYTNTSSTETLFARIQNSNNPDCYDTTSFDLIVQEAPIVNTQDDWTVCDSDLDGFHTFDFAQKTTTILAANDASMFTVSYYLSQTDLDAKTNSIAINFTNTVPSTEIFFRIENNTFPTCYGEGAFFLEVISGVAANTPTDFEVCDDNNDGIFAFDLTTKESEIIGVQNAASVTISFHTTLLEAENGSNPVHKNIFSNVTPYNQTLYIRVENSSDSNCYDTTPLDLVISDSPVVQTVADWQVCDVDNDGVSSFDLSQKTAEILGNQSDTKFLVSYYLSEVDAQTPQNSITGSFDNTTSPQNIFYRLENSSNAECFITDHFSLEVFNTPTAATATPFVVCDTNETGINTFDLSQKDMEVLNGQDINTFAVSYFANETDATTNQNSLPKTAYTNATLGETLFARVHATNLEACYAISSFEISIRELPQPVVQDTYVICPDSPELTIDGGAFESWIWRDAQNNEISTDRFLNAAALGEYTLTVSHSPTGLTCEKTIVFEVVSSGAPEDFTTEIKNFSDQVTIAINTTGTGDFEYSIDGENFQDSSSLIVFPGTYTVYVRDTFLCRTITKEVIALGYQKFFTPNNDGSNDYWNIIGAENFPESKIFIFDRQGKLLKQLTPDSAGWDGTFNGLQMPASDYWFRFTNDDGIVFTGHFSLKR